jgi:hypothetical protein
MDVLTNPEIGFACNEEGKQKHSHKWHSLTLPSHNKGGKIKRKENDWTRFYSDPGM